MSVGGDIVDATDVKEWNEYDMWNVRHVMEGPLSVRKCLVPDDLLCVRTTAAKSNTAGLYGPFAEFHFVLLRNGVKHVPSSRSEKPNFRCDYRQLFGFDPDAVTWLVDCLWHCVEPALSVLDDDNCRMAT